MILDRLDRIKNYIESKDLEIHIYKKGIYIVNYAVIANFSDNKIEIKNNKAITIIGNNLVITKLQKDELFISGDIKELLLG